MDPISAIGIAAAIVQFAEFGYKLVAKTRIVAKKASGQNVEQIELATVSYDLGQLFDGVESKIEQGASQQKVDQDDIGSGASSQTFVRLCQECRDIRDELQSLFQSWRPGKSRMDLESLRLLLRRAFDIDKIDKLAGRLKEVRQQTMIALLCLLM
jgi:hypothetical protein